MDKGSPAFGPEALVDAALPFHLLQNSLTYYLDVPCFLLRAGDWKTWHTVVPLRPKNTPIDYENPRQWEGRIRYNERLLNRALRTGRPVSEAHHGLQGLFVPVLRKGRALGVLMAGPYLDRVPGEAELLAHWRGLSGRAPKPQEEAFLGYTRAMASTPVLDTPVVEALGQMLELFGAVLSLSLEPAEAAARMGRLQAGVFARRLSHRQWVDWQVIQPKFFRFSGDPKTLMPWEVEELGITRFPQVVMAAKREGTGRDWADTLGAMAFQQQARVVAAGLGETLAYPLSHYGVLLLSSASPGQGRARAAEELRAKAAEFSRRISAVLDGKIWVGLGRPSVDGYGLQASYHEALAALQLAVVQDRPVLEYPGEAAQDHGETELRRRIMALARSLAEEGPSVAARQRSLFVQAVLLGTRGRPEATRRAFIETLHRLTDLLEARRSLDEAELMKLESEAGNRLENAINLDEMVGRFETGLGQLVELLERPVSGAKGLRLRRAQEAVAADLDKPWTLPLAARQFGFSTTVFSREFAAQAGEPFSAFLLGRRLDKARRLLAEGDLPLAAVAEACGFSSLNYFLQVFKRKVGHSPGRYRRDSKAPD